MYENISVLKNLLYIGPVGCTDTADCCNFIGGYEALDVKDFVCESLIAYTVSFAFRMSLRTQSIIAMIGAKTLNAGRSHENTHQLCEIQYNSQATGTGIEILNNEQVN